MNNTQDKNNEKNSGFSGLSTLISRIEDEGPKDKAELSANPQPEVLSSSEESVAASTDIPGTPAIQTQKKPEIDSAEDVKAGKWMVGIGLGIGLIIVIFLNLNKQESVRPITPSATQKSTSIGSPNPMPTGAPYGQSKDTHGTFTTQVRAAEFITALGQQLKFYNPEGYCTPGKSPPEVELIELARRSIGDASRLLHLGVSCSELNEFRTGRRDMLDHWLQIQLLGHKGSFQRIETSREAFLSGLSKATPKIDSAELNRRLRTSLESQDVSLSGMRYQQIGRDGNAVYYSIQIEMTVGDTRRLISGLSAITLLNALPVSVNIYEATGSAQSRARLQTSQQELMISLLSEN
jgi:hypothetical protein